jgi:phosphatidylglycerol:prolipoprotein diacylglycerol transferase
VASVSSELMITPLYATASGMPGMQMGLHGGRLRFSLYGTCAAAGLIAALWLSQRTARMAGLRPEQVWDAGILSICAAFVVSRLLLIVRDPSAFLKYPMLVLALPSLTYGGMALTALIVWGYVRWKRLRLLDVLDAWAPCGALLGAALSLGHFLEGTDTGMPTTLPWGVTLPGDAAFGRVHPVQIYAMIAALLLCGLLLWALQWRQRRGSIAAMALMAGGAISFVLDLMTQPVDIPGTAWFGTAWFGKLLEEGQWIALAAVLAGGWLWVMATPVRTEVRAGGVLERDQDRAGQKVEESR